MPVDSLQAPVRLPKLAIIASIIAFLLALAGLLSTFHHVFLVFSALIPAIAAITILRRQAWGAYGFALFEVAQLALIPVIVFRASAVPRAQMAVVAVMYLALSLLFFFAGRALTAAGATRGFVLPWAILALLFTIPFCFLNAFVIPTGGMEDTLLPGDRIIVRTFPRITPQRDEIIVFHYPVDRRQIFIKRVIGVPGDRIRIVSQVIYRNGAPLSEPYAVHKLQRWNDPLNNFPGSSPDVAGFRYPGETPSAEEMLRNHVVNGDLVVPPNKYFVLGDNRDSSLDSRYWGFLDRSDVIGRPLFIYDSEVLQATDTSSRSFFRIQTRWNRIFKLL